MRIKVARRSTSVVIQKGLRAATGQVSGHDAGGGHNMTAISCMSPELSGPVLKRV
jgi:hypothetical protein